MNNRFLNYRESLKRLQAVLEQRKIHIAYDFDDTIYPLYSHNDNCEKVIELLKLWRPHAYFILFTHRRSELIGDALYFIKTNDIPLDEVNENKKAFDFYTSDSPKPYFDILLDDKAGLGETYSLLFDLGKNNSIF